MMAFSNCTDRRRGRYRRRKPPKTKSFQHERISDVRAASVNDGGDRWRIMQMTGGDACTAIEAVGVRAGFRFP